MNFLYYKGFSDDKTSSAHVGYKKKKDVKKKNSCHQHGLEGHPHLTRHSLLHTPTTLLAGHVLGCECEVCTTEFPLRTHLLIDMSYSRLNQDQTPKTSTTSRFNFFRRKKTSGINAAAQTSAALALIRERKRISDEKEQQEARLEAEEMAARLQEPVTLSTLKQDSLMIPVAKMQHFFPAGHPVRQTLPHSVFGIPSGSMQTGRMRVLEAPEQNIQVVFHMMGPATPVTPALSSPLTQLYAIQRETILKAFKSAISGATSGGGAVLQGMVLVNLERGGEMGAVEFPFMIVWVVEGKILDCRNVVEKLKKVSLEAFDPIQTGFTCHHYFDTFQEVATLARPPLEKLSRKATTSATGYIITVFKVFEGDDSVKFERNWLGWTGARTLYKSLTSEVGLRRLTLHKSVGQRTTENGTHHQLHYVLLCDCSHFLTSIHHAVKAIPSLRMRLCGDMGLYRPIATY